MVRTQELSNIRRYRNPSITVRQTVKAGKRLSVSIHKRKKQSPVSVFFGKLFNIVKLGLFVGAAVCPVTCVFVILWMLLD